MWNFIIEIFIQFEKRQVETHEEKEMKEFLDGFKISHV